MPTSRQTPAPLAALPLALLRCPRLPQSRSRSVTLLRAAQQRSRLRSWRPVLVLHLSWRWTWTWMGPARLAAQLLHESAVLAAASTLVLR